MGDCGNSHRHPGEGRRRRPGSTLPADGFV